MKNKVIWIYDIGEKQQWLITSFILLSAFHVLSIYNSSLYFFKEEIIIYNIVFLSHLYIEIDRSKAFMMQTSWMGSNWYLYTRNQETQIWVSALQLSASLALDNLFIKLKAKSHLFQSKSQAIAGKENLSELFFSLFFFFPLLTFIKTIFLEQFQVHRKIERKVQRFPIYLLPPLMHSLLHYPHPHQRGTFATNDEIKLTKYNHPKSTVYITVHSWILVLYILWVRKNV